MHHLASTKRDLRAALAAASHDIVRGQPERLTVVQARLLALGGWCFHAASPGSPHRQHLALDFARDWQQQQQRAAALVPLLLAWQQAGIRAVAFKGFAMAWGMYPHPAMRYCGDVDLLMSRADAQRALALAVPGWQLAPIAPLGDQRAAFAAFHPASGLALDVQVDLLPAHGLRLQQGGRITARMLADANLAVPLQAGGQSASLLALRPDDLLLALAINRGWAADAWRNKPHDYLDMVFTVQRHGLQASALQQRAQQLGLLAPWRAFLRHCNPFAQHFDLIGTRDNLLHRLQNHLCPVSPRQPVPMAWAKAVQRVRRALPGVPRVLRAMPVVLGVLQDLRRHPTPAAASAARPAAVQQPHQPAWEPWKAAQAARWALRLLKPLHRHTDAGPCVLYSLTLLRLLQQHGHAVNWCLGYRPAQGAAPVAHAWVACADPFAFGLEEHHHNARYQVVVRNGPALPTGPAAHPDTAVDGHSPARAHAA